MKGLEAYTYIMDNVSDVDVSDDETFQWKYINFYKMRRRTKEFKSLYFKFMQASKNLTTSIKSVVDYLYEKTKKIELSFSSKLVHTLNPEEPIYDSVLAEFFDCKYWPYQDKNKRIEIYNEFKKKFSCLKILIMAKIS